MACIFVLVSLVTIRFSFQWEIGFGFTSSHFYFLATLKNVAEAFLGGDEENGWMNEMR